MPEAGRETGKYVRFLDQALARLSTEQHAVFGLDQLTALGLTSAAVHKRLATGRLHRIHHTVYSVVPRELLNAKRLIAVGWTVIRTTWRQMTRRPHELAPLLLKLLVPGSPDAHG